MLFPLTGLSQFWNTSSSGPDIIFWERNVNFCEYVVLKRYVFLFHLCVFTTTWKKNNHSLSERMSVQFRCVYGEMSEPFEKYLQITSFFIKMKIYIKKA